MSSPSVLMTGAQSPRLLVAPESVLSVGDVASGYIESATDLVLDDWQKLVLDVAFAKRADDKWSAFEVGLIVPRQNGKGTILEAMEIAGLFLFKERLILHSAHEFRTAQEGFRRVLGLIEDSPELSKQIARVRTSHGEEGVETVDGCRLRFVSRSTGSSRGMSADRVILDEAYRLTSAMMAAMLPTLSARPNPQIVYTTSTPGTIDEYTAHIRNMKARAEAGGSERMAWIEWSSELSDDPDDHGTWAAANPGFGIRIDADFIKAERAALTDDAFLVERLGVWPSEIEARWVIPAEAWLRQSDGAVERQGRIVFGLDVDPDRTRASMGASWQRPDGRYQVAVADQRDGVKWVVDLAAGWDAPVVVDARSPAAALIPELEASGVDVVLASASDYAQACGMFFDGIVEGRVFHDEDDSLTAAVSGASKRPLSESWAWDRRSVNVDITPLVATSLALWGRMGPVEPVKPVFFH